MRFNQLQDLLQHFVDGRGAMVALYRRLESQADAERVRMLLAYLQDREKQNSQHVSEFIEQAGHEVLDTWLDMPADEKLSEKCSKLYLPATMTSDDVVAKVIELDGLSLAPLAQVKDELTMVGAQQFVANLLEHQQKRQQQLVHSVHRLDDI